MKRNTFNSSRHTLTLITSAACNEIPYQKDSSSTWPVASSCRIHGRPLLATSPDNGITHTVLYSATSGNCSCSGAVRHRQSGRTAYRP